MLVPVFRKELEANFRDGTRRMAITGKIRQKVRDGSLQEMWREAKWMFVYIRRYRAVVGIHILLGIFDFLDSFTCLCHSYTILDSLFAKNFFLR